MLETYRECLRDVLDVPGLNELLRALHRRELSLVEVETPTASPFASRLLFDYVATYMYEGDTPNAERRAAALSLDRDLLRELLGQEELRELIDPAALEQVEVDLQHRSDRTRADSRDALADVLRRVGDLTGAEVADRVLAGLDAAAMLAELERERRAVRVRVGGEERWIAADDAGLYRDAFGAVPARRAARGVPRRRRGPAREARRPLRAHARPVHDRRGARALRRRPDQRPDGARALRRARARRAAPGRQRARVVRPRGAAPAAPRLARGAAQGDRGRRPAGARRLPARVAGRRPPSVGRRRRRPPARGARPAAGPRAARRRVGARRPAAPLRRLLADLDGPAVRQRRGRVGRRRRAGPQLRPRRALLPRRRRGDRPAARTSPSGRTCPSTSDARAPRPGARASSPTCSPS